MYRGVKAYLYIHFSISGTCGESIRTVSYVAGGISGAAALCRSLPGSVSAGESAVFGAFCRARHVRRTAQPANVFPRCGIGRWTGGRFCGMLAQGVPERTANGPPRARRADEEDMKWR